MLERNVDGLLVLEDLILAEVLRLAQSLGVQDRAGAELKGLESLVSVGDVIPGDNYSVVFHDDGLVVRVFLELGHDLLSKKLASREGIFSESDRAAGRARLRDYARVRDLVDHAECHQSRRVGVDHRMNMRVHLVDGLVERVLGGRSVRTYDGSVGLHTHDVRRCK